MTPAKLSDVLDGIELPDNVNPELFANAKIGSTTGDHDIVLTFFHDDTGSLHPKPYNGSGGADDIRAWFERTVADACDIAERAFLVNGVSGASCQDIEVLSLWARPDVLTD